jgi:mono/diheme cytochrome c family protein
MTRSSVIDHPVVACRLVACLVVAGCAGEIGGGGGGPGVTTPLTDLPCEVESMLANRCWSCHGPTPLAGLPSLTTVAALRAPSRTDASKTNAELALGRMQNDVLPMPPAPAARATAADVEVLTAWVNSGYMSGAGCAPVCTSNITWTGGNRESPQMNPGMACIQCHTSQNEGPRFSIAGTVYPTVHEPDLCYGADGANGAQVVVTGGDGVVLTLEVNSAGNFFAEQRVVLPYRAKVVYMGREQVMTDAQTSGDCNSCHTQAGASNAPGRILLP